MGAKPARLRRRVLAPPGSDGGYETSGGGSQTGGYVAQRLATNRGITARGHTAPGEDDLEGCEARLKPLLEDPEIGKTGHNLKYDLVVLARAGNALRGLRFDTVAGSYLSRHKCGII